MFCKTAIQESPSHQIVFDNIINGEVLNYSLLICNGHVEKAKQAKCNILTDVLQVTHNKITKAVNINSKTNEFKFLVDLELGANDINVLFCCTSSNVSVEYKLCSRNLCVLPLYIICKDHDGTFQAPETEPNTPDSACARIMTGCKMLQSLYAEKLYEAGLGRKTFQLKSPTCLKFYSQLHYEEAYKMDQVKLWYDIAREVMKSNIGSNDVKYLAFLSCTRYDGSNYSEDLKEHSDIISLTKGYVAFGGEGLALLSTACLYTWPCTVFEIENRFTDKSLVDKRKFMDDSCYRETLGGCFATTLGAALHELSHTFDLGHSETGIMGRGFDNIQNVFLSDTNDDKTDQCEKIKLSTLPYIRNNRKPNSDIYWTENCLLFLSFHRWFNNFVMKRKRILQYDRSCKIIKSTAGLRVAEIRRKSDEMVFRYWIFKEKVLKYSYQIGEVGDLNGILVVEDNEGNIIKEEL